MLEIAPRLYLERLKKLKIININNNLGRFLGVKGL